VSLREPMDPTDQNLKTLLMKDPARSLAVAESLTTGHVQARIGAISGASLFFRGGVTAYTLKAKVELLGVDREGAERCDCVSETVALQMARGVTKLFEANIGVATTGYAELDAEAGVSSPYAWWAIVEQLPNGDLAERSGRVVTPLLDRVAVQDLVTDKVWMALMDYLRAMAEPTGSS